MIGDYLENLLDLCMDYRSPLKIFSKLMICLRVMEQL